MTGQALEGALGRLLEAEPRAPAVAVAALAAGRTHILPRGSPVRGGAAQDGAGSTLPSTRFEIGSVTKTFTALLLAQVAAAGEADPHTPVAHLVPEAGDGLPGVTLHHLATHTSGLPRIPPGLIRTAVPRWFSNPYASFGEAELLRSVRRARTSRPPGRRVHYSNLGVALLGHALTRAVRAASFAELLAERVLGPLGMERTDCTGRDQATGHWFGRPREPFALPGMPAAGAVRSSARDMLGYLVSHLDPQRIACASGAGPGGRAEEGVGGPAAGHTSALREALAQVSRPLLRHPRGDDRLGLVWNIRQRPGHRLVFHAGATPGFVAFAGFSPEAHVAVVALANDTRAGGCPALVQNAYLTLRELAGRTG